MANTSGLVALPQAWNNGRLQDQLDDMTQRIDTGQITPRTFSLNLLRQGVIAEVRVGRWRGTASLDERDLGIQISSEAKKTLHSLGERILMPAEMLRAADAIESRARRLVDPKSNRALVATPLGVFIPVTAFPDIQQEFRDCRADYFNLRDHWVRRLPDIREEMLAAYTAAAREAWERLQREDAFFTRGYADEQDYVRQFLNRTLYAIPSASKISSSFYMELRLFMVPLPTDLDDNAAEQLLEMQRAALELSQIEREEWQNRSATQERQRVLDEMTREAMRQQNELLQTLARDFEGTVVRQMNQVAYEAATDLLAAIERNGRPNSRNIVTLKNMVETLKQANFTDNAEIEAMLGQVEAQLDVPASQREVRALDLVLRDIAIVSRQNILALGGETDARRDLAIGPVTADTAEMSRRRLMDEVVTDIQPQATIDFNRPQL